MNLGQMFGAGGSGSAKETDPLIRSSMAGGNSPSSYYFLKQQQQQEGDEEGNRSVSKGENTDEVIDLVPDGKSGEQFASRKINDRLLEKKPSGGKQTAATSGSGGNALTPTEPARLVRQRKVPVKVEPKVFFANERTFLAWLHTSIMLAGAAIAILAFADANPWSQLYGVLLLPVAMAFICYAMYQFARRSAMIRRKDPGPYEDIAGPTVLGIMLMLSIVAQFAIKLYSTM